MNSPNVRMSNSGSLDADAKKHANLLLNPCNAPLCHPIYDGADGGILFRSETDFIYANGATDTCGVLFWAPGGTGVLAGNATNLYGFTNTLGNLTATPAALNDQFCPGGVYLAANAAASTCVAACMQIYWPGTENNRQGYIAYGNVPARTINVTTPTSADQFSQVLMHAERTPNTKIEIRWRPGAGDQVTTDPAAATPDSEYAKRNGIGFSVRGLPTATGLRIRLVAVYQYEPKAGLGIVNSNARAMSNNSFDHVINFLDRMGDWMATGVATMDRIAQAATPVVTAVAYGATKRQGLLT